MYPRFGRISKVAPPQLALMAQTRLLKRDFTEAIGFELGYTCVPLEEPPSREP
jgi:hypothetical protein